ncbi:DUF4157 domain-containing protein [Kitasatospora sp. NPDC056184]|uniref:eCIS core domain-containing protein n=1 Tax=Kitasatospora sp. NPDC056184 TaxID=3345738 RepID=UPI0035D9B2A7
MSRPTATTTAATATASKGSEQGAARRRTRTPKARTPEPKEIVSGAGQPLDPGLRRELEARLGHDLGRVRVHTDRDSAALTELLGADAVAVGPDLFFAEGRYRPAAEDGRRLLTHELLHTVQAPNPLGALRAGRDLGAVSLPQDAIEREAEHTARGEGPAAATPGATPGWLRYATVDADRFRTERLDPATLVDRLAGGILRSLRGDPTDSSGRVRLQLARFAPELQASVLERLADRLPSSDYTRVLELVEAAEHRPAEVDGAQTPEPVTETAGPTAEQEPGPTGQTGRPGKPVQEDDRPDGPEGRPEQGEEQDGTPGGEEHPQQQDRQDARPAPPAEGATAPEAPTAAPAPAPAPVETAPVTAPETPAPAAETAPVTGTPEAAQPEAAVQPSAGTRPQEPAAAAPQPAPVEPERLDAVAQSPDSPLARHGLLEGDHPQGEPQDQERPLGVETGAESEVREAPGADQEEPPQPAAAEQGLGPADFLPSADLDLSAVPTLDRLSLSTGGASAANAEAPAFPEPPATKAEKVQEERESRPEVDEEPAAPLAPAQPEAAVPPTPAAEAGEAGEAGEAEDRAGRDLQPEHPVEQEIGPDPAQDPARAAEPTAPEPRPEAEEQPEAPAEEAREAAPEPDVPAPTAAPATANAGAGPVGGEAPGRPTGALDSTLDGAPGAAPGPAAEQADAPAELAARPAPDASLESGGGACAGPQQPTTEAEPDAAGGGGGGGGTGCAAGGGGAPAEREEKPAPPDVSGQDPQSALATAASLPPDQLATTLDGVDGSVDRTVGEQHARLQAAPPTARRPSGAPQTRSGPPEAAPPAEAVTERLERVGPEGADGRKQQAEQKKAEGRNPADRVADPHVADDAGNQVSAQEVQRVQVAVDGVPSTDPALNTTVGPAPRVELTGESDPARTDRQAAKLTESSGRILGVGREDTAKPMGEDLIYPDVPQETLTASVPGGGGKGGAARAGGTVGAEPGIGVVTQQERGPQIQAAVGQGQGRLGSEQAAQRQGEADARRQNQAEIDRAVADNAEAQAGERGDAAEKVRAERERWRTEQDGRIRTADQDAGTEHRDTSGRIDDKRTAADKDVQDRRQQDNRKIQDKRKEAEEKARKEKDRKKEESEGWWGWVKSKVKAAFDALVEAVTKVFDYFRGLINDIIDGFRTFANWAIDQARKFAVELITRLADALIRICDVLLAAFPELRDRFRKKIEEWRDRAIAEVNAWADRLKNAVNKLLDALAAGLNALLNALEAGLKAAVEAVRKAVLDAIDFVRKAIAVFGEFAALIGDIAPDPGGWLKKLGTAAIDGIQHHLWGAIKSAVRTWFNEKVESVVGLTSTIVNVLVKGCISMAQIGRMAWQAIVAALPGMIISLVVEKLVSMIVPAAGAIMAIVQGLVAAWNTISRIVAAIGKFVAFLKAVKSGSAACLFADAVAAGVVALLDFISNFLLSKLKGAGKAVGTRLKGIAQRILKGLAKAGKGARKAAGNAVNKARASLRRATRSLRRRPSPGRPRPARTGPARHTVGPAERPTAHRPAATPGRPRREAARPKPTARRRAASPVGRALNASRQTVRAALSRVRAAARALGRKLLTSRLGRALTNGAHRIRDAYRKQRDRLRAWQRKRRQQRAERRAHENSPEAKRQRLDLVVARIRPRVQRMLARGVPRPALRAALAGMRLWYRLTDLAVRGAEHFGIVALINPEDLVLKGQDVTISRREVLEFLHRLAKEIENDPGIVKASGNVDVTQKEPGSVPRHTVREPVPAPAITRKTRALDPLQQKEQDVLDFPDEQGQIASLRRTQTGDKAANKVVVGEGFLSEEQLSHIYLTKTTKGVKKPGIADELTKNGQWDAYVTFMDNFFRGRPQPSGIPKKDRTDMLKTAWLLAGQEVERDPQALVTNALVVQRLVNEKEGKNRPRVLKGVFESLPAAFSGSEKGGEWLTDDLAGTRSIESERDRIKAERAADVEKLKQMRADPGVGKAQVDEFNRESRNRYNRELRPLKNADKLADRHVRSVAAWVKDFGIEERIPAIVKEFGLESVDPTDERVKQALFAKIGAVLKDMYLAENRK